MRKRQNRQNQDLQNMMAALSAIPPFNQPPKEWSAILAQIAGRWLEEERPIAEAVKWVSQGVWDPDEAASAQIEILRWLKGNRKQPPPEMLMSLCF